MPEYLAWIDPSGVVTEFFKSDTPLPKSSAYPIALAGRTGDLMPPYEFATDVLPTRHGEILLQVRTGARTVKVPLLVEAADASTMSDWLRTFAYRLDPLRGDGTLRVITEWGDTRDLTCRYRRGLEGDASVENANPLWRFLNLEFYAADPYWQSATESTLQVAASNATTFFPFFPLILPLTGQSIDTTTYNDGDVHAYPIWTVHGPFTMFRATNLDTGELFQLDYSAGASDVVIIDTRPDRVTPYLQALGIDDGNLFSYLTEASELWTLPPGTTNLRIEFSNTTSATTASVSFRWRYRSA